MSALKLCRPPCRGTRNGVCDGTRPGCCQQFKSPAPPEHSTQEDIGPPLAKPAPSAEAAFAQVRAGILTLHGERLVVRTRPSHEWGESEELSLDDLRLLLSRAGLAIVPAADVPSAVDRKVLEACAAMTEEGIDAATGQSLSVDRALQAELARRAAKEGKTDG